MTTAVVIDAVRTPIGRAHAQRGQFRDERADDLAAACLRALLERVAVPLDRIDDVLLGCAQQLGEQGHNAARKIALMAGIPHTAAACTVNRLCGSGLQALHQATHALLAGDADIQVVGGFEHMGHVPMDRLLDHSRQLFAAMSPAAAHMGLTAENLARVYNIDRAAQDAFALASHQKASAAHAAGEFLAEIVPQRGRDESGRLILATRDQSVRGDTTLAALAALEPVFLPSIGTVTAGNSSPLSDGAAALLLMSDHTARELKVQPLATVRATAVAGVEPCLMGTGPVPAIRKLLARAQLTLDEIGLVEINEAFAVQTLACLKLLNLSAEKVNVCGGALALGHPLGASGARIATTLLHAMHRRGVRYGIAAMCIGYGQGIATLFERVA
jgi:acetyl-CoA acyltransferase